MIMLSDSSSLHRRIDKMSLFKFGFTSRSYKNKEEEKQTKGRMETKQKYEKEKQKHRFLFPNGKMILNGLRLHIKGVQLLLFFFVTLYQLTTSSLLLFCSKPVCKCST